MLGKVAATFALVLALAAAVALGAADGAPAETIVPVAGPWHATTSVGLPVSFEVSNGQVLNPRFRFRWGFCGTFETDSQASVPIEADGRWKYLDPRGPYIEGTFVSPNEIEGSVTAPSRMLPGCPETRADFVAEPGAAPFRQAPSVVNAEVGMHRLVHEPKRMNMSHDGSMVFYGLEWRKFGGDVARGSGHAYLRRGCRSCRNRVVRRPRVTVLLDELAQQGERRVYLHLRYEFDGRVPPGFHHRGSRYFS